MKILTKGAIGAIALVLASAANTSAIEGLQISLECSNVVLSWPSIEGESYIVQYRPTLDPGIAWQTLTNDLPATSGTNITLFVHSNIVQYPNCGGSGMSAMMSSAGGSTSARLALNREIPLGLA